LGFGGQLAQAAAARGGFVVEESREANPAAVHAAAEGDCRRERARAGDDRDAGPRAADGACGARAGVGYARHACIRDQRQRLAFVNAPENFFFARALVELVTGDERRGDAVAFEKNPRAARVFG